jgi:hypothetical protein
MIYIQEFALLCISLSLSSFTWYLVSTFWLSSFEFQLSLRGILMFSLLLIKMLLGFVVRLDCPELKSQDG